MTAMREPQRDHSWVSAILKTAPVWGQIVEMGTEGFGAVDFKGDQGFALDPFISGSKHKDQGSRHTRCPTFTYIRSGGRAAAKAEGDVLEVPVVVVVVVAAEVEAAVVEAAPAQTAEV